ncbi:MAG: ASCH domain-containing protein [Phenylobacterium sp.]|uniref:ASCH domain-containing protein n=1 Tax=Phenylobacterium sp. TaxID=1871053 RepID=UPI0025EBB892|nr:ASCH domain-containing protein [Phenylobacterium sp.]MBI1198711.1 ASCH domain-containing protein [Phenylobacterium sp.]
MGPDCERRAILERLRDHVPANSGWGRRLSDLLAEEEISVGVHLAIFVEPFLSAVLDGRKTVESRFGVHRRPPYRCVDPNDIILIKRSGGPIVGVAQAGAATFHQLSPRVLSDIREQFAGQLFALDDAFWESRAEKQYATLIELNDPVEVTPLPFPKRDRQGWVIIDRRPEREPQLAFQ